MEDKELKFDIVRHLGVLSEGTRSWRRELNMVAWNDREAKLDIRDWSVDHAKMSKGVTLTRAEAEKLVELLSTYLKS